MTVGGRNDRWKLLAIGMAFAIGSALESGFVVAQWTAKDSHQKVVEVGQVCAALDAGGSQTTEGACSARLLAGLPR
jgi:methyl coenzyme M reductase alpha subunit